MKNKNLWIGIGIVVIIIIVILAVLKKNQILGNDDAIRVGVILPLTGPVSDDGNELLLGIKIAEEKINNNVNGKKIKIFPEDSKLEGKSAVVAYNSLITKGIDAIIVAGDHPCQAISPLVSRDKIPTIATLISINISELSEWMFAGWFYIPEVASVMATYMRTVEKADEIAIFYGNTLHGIASMETFKSTFEGLGGKVVSIVPYPANATSLKSEIMKLLENKPKSVYVTGFAQGMITALNELDQVGYDGVVCADNAAADNVVVNNITKPEGIRFIDIDFDSECLNNDDAISVLRTYERFVSGRRVSSQAVLAYQALTILAGALSTRSSADEVRSYILSINNMHTIIGDISYRNDRKLTMPLIVKKYGSNKEKITLNNDIWSRLIKQ